MQSKKLLYFLYAFLLFLFAVFLLSKTSSAYFEDMFEESGDDSDSSEIDPAVEDSITADESDLATVNGSVYLEGEFLDGDILKVSAFAEDIAAPTLGVAFHLLYEQNKLSFLKYEPGEFLEQGGDPFYLVKNLSDKGAVAAPETGTVIFGQTLRQNDSFPVGQGRIADFYFQITDGKDFSFKFDHGVVSSIDTVRQDLNNIEWKELSLSKNGLFDFLNFNIGDKSTANQSSLLNFKTVAIILLSIFGLFMLTLKLIKISKKFRGYPKFHLNS
jgi:hypothetical protein